MRDQIYGRVNQSVFAVSIAFSLLFAEAVLAQPPVDRKQSNSLKLSNQDPAVLRWKILLGSLAQESRTVFPEDRRPFAIVDVANAYWEIDHDASRQLYLLAFDSALSLIHQDEKYRGLLNYVLSAATRTDAGLAKELTKRLVDKESYNEAVSIETAQEMLDENPVAAAQLAEAFAPGGLSDGTAMFLIFSIARKDIALSNRVYAVYLDKVTRNEGIELESLLALAGYAFGNSEYYSVDKVGALSGASFPSVPGLSVNQTLTSAFLNLAQQRLKLAIERRDRSVGKEIEQLNFPILFASEYLLPEVAKYSPETLPAWRQLQQRSIVGATTAQTQQVQNYILQIQQTRLRIQKFSNDSQTPEIEAEKSLEDVEKLPGTCQRDVIRSKAALLFASRKNFKRALEIAGKIEDLKQIESVKQAITMSMVESAIENGDLDEAEVKVSKISSAEHKARLYVMLADAFSRGNDRQRTQEIRNEAIKLIGKLSDARDQSAMSFSLSAIVLRSDPLEAWPVLRDAIRNLNKNEPVDKPSFVIPIKVPLSCPGEEVTWYGGFETISNSNVFDTLAMFAMENPDEAIRSTDEIGDKITKIRGQALITKLALRKLLSHRTLLR
jgi:hypothetical protein